MAENCSLLNDLSSKDKRQCIETLIKIYRNTIESDDEKYRKLRTTNKRFLNDVWRHEEAQLLLLEAGWEIDGEFLILPSGADVTPSLALLLDNRQVTPDAKEWVKETKVIVKNPAVAKEEMLREKALEEKKKEMARLKKDMAERKAIAARVLAEHRNDREEKKCTKPSVAKKRGDGGVAKMSDMLPEGGG